MTAAAALTVALLAAAAPLFAMGSEGWWGLAPCALCLWQRWPYWVAAGLAAGAALVTARGRGRRVLLGLAGVAVLVSGGIAALHVGVEQGWWPSPLPVCAVARASGAAASVEELLRGMAAAPTKPCDAPTHLIEGLPLSMAAMNLLYALGLAAFALSMAVRGTRRG
jgi:disulfide bond formation protein DsbB